MRPAILPILLSLLLCFVTFFPSFVTGQQPKISGGTEKQVIDRFWDILLRSPHRGTTFERVYGYYADTGHTDLLLQRCREFLEKEPENAKFRMLLGLVMERRGDLDGAVRAFTEAAKLDTKNPLAPFYQGENLLAQTRLREAIDALEESLRRKPARNDIRNVMQTLARVYERFGEPQKSLNVWARLEQMFPDDPELIVQIAETLESEGRWDEALLRYERLAKETKDEFAGVRYAMSAAEILLRQGKAGEALTQLGSLLDRLAPESWVAESVRERIDRIFVRNHDLSGQADFYHKRLEKNPTEAGSVKRLAQTLRRLDRSDEARKILEDTLTKIPSNIPLRLAMIDFLVEQKEFTAAAEQFRTLDRLQPNNVDFLARWGQVLFDDPDCDEKVRKAEAVAVWRRIADNAPENPAAAVTLADLLVRNRLYDEAEQYYRRALELRPAELSYREYLAMFYHARRDKEKVLATLRPTAEGKNRTVENLSSLGVTLLSLGYVEESFEPFRDAAEMAPNDLAVQWRYAEALVRHGDWQTASEQLRKAENLVDGDDAFDDFVQREVRFLQSVRKLGIAAEDLRARLESGTDDSFRSWWRLAVYRLAMVENRAASEAVEEAVTISKRNGTSPLRLLRSAAEIFERSGDFEKAIAIYDNLARIDGVWRVEHLKRLASLQIRIGRSDQALETGRLVMGLGSGNASNIRFYADLLLSLGRRDGGVDILRQALRVEPGDVATLTLLAETLADVGREAEAVEIVWRLFERTDNVSGKLGLVEKLSTYYQRAGRFDELLDRLQSRLNAAEDKREAALCLARAFVTTAQFEQARQTLEDRLAAPGRGDDETVATLMLRELVSIAQRQDDVTAAVQYQERLAWLTRHPADQDRLFTLYDQVGETEKASELFMGRVLLQGTLDEKLVGIDRMIGRERYDIVLKVFDFLEIHENATWQVPFRRIAVESYLGLEDVDELVWDFRALTFPDTGPASIPATARGERLTTAPPQPWILPGTNFSRPGSPPDRESFEWVDAAPDDFLSSLYVQEQFLPTLFRNRLRKNERFSLQGVAPPPKPFFKVERFADARFLSLAWLLRDAVERDMQTPNATSFVNFEDCAEEIRNEYLNGDRLEQMRFEIFLVSVSRLDEGRNALAGGRLKAGVDREKSRKTIRKIIRQLGLEGETDWQAATLLILLDEILDRRIANRFAGKDIEAELAIILDTNLRDRKIPALSEESRRAAFKRVGERIRAAMEERNDEFVETEQLGRVVELWHRLIVQDDPKRMEIFASKIAVEFPKLVWLLETSGRNDEVTALRQSLEQLGKRDPVFPARLAVEISLPMNDDLLLLPVLAEYDSIGTQLDQMMPWLLSARNGIEKTDDNDDNKLRRQTIDAVMESLSTLFRPGTLYRYGIFSSQEIDLIGIPVEEMRDLLNRANQSPSAHFARRLVGLEEHESVERRTVTETQEARIREFAEDFRRLADYSFEFIARFPGSVDEESVTEGKIPKPLSNYEQELRGRGVVDRSLLRSVLHGQRFYTPLSKSEKFFYRLVLVGRALDTTLQNLGRDVDGRFKPMPTGFSDEIRRRLETPTVTATSAELRDVLVEILWPPEHTDETLNAEDVRLAKRLEETLRNRAQRNLPPDPALLLASALLKAKAKTFDEVMPILDRIPLRSPQDVAAREFIAAGLGDRSGGEIRTDETIKRGETALDRLIGYRLSGNESFRLYHLLNAYGRGDDARTVLDRLIETSTDRQIQAWLVELCGSPMMPGMEASVKIARRVLRNPAFFADPRFFAADAQVYTAALNILKKYDKVDAVVEMLEARYKGLRDKTDGTILLAELYRMVGRNGEARELVGELARNPSRDSDRRGMVTKLLQHFGMRKELEEMNERLMAPIYRPDPPPP